MKLAKIIDLKRAIWYHIFIESYVESVKKSYARVDESSKFAYFSGMADEADSKSVVGNHVWVQVPLPALKSKRSLCL